MKLNNFIKKASYLIQEKNRLMDKFEGITIPCKVLTPSDRILGGILGFKTESAIYYKQDIVNALVLAFGELCPLGSSSLRKLLEETLAHSEDINARIIHLEELRAKETKGLFERFLDQIKEKNLNLIHKLLADIERDKPSSFHAFIASSPCQRLHIGYRLVEEQEIRQAFNRFIEEVHERNLVFLNEFCDEHGITDVKTREACEAQIEKLYEGLTINENDIRREYNRIIINQAMNKGATRKLDYFHNEAFRNAFANTDIGKKYVKNAIFFGGQKIEENDLLHLKKSIRNAEDT